MIRVSFGPGGVEGVASVAENEIEDGLNPALWAFIYPEIRKIHLLLKKQSLDLLLRLRERDMVTPKRAEGKGHDEYTIGAE